MTTGHDIEQEVKDEIYDEKVEKAKKVLKNKLQETIRARKEWEAAGERYTKRINEYGDMKSMSVDELSEKDIRFGGTVSFTGNSYIIGPSEE